MYLLTMGQGDQIWERYGHNAIGIRDARDGTDIVYNWGLFSFAEPGFLTRFLRGDLRYWMGPADGAATVVEYVTLNRTVTIQELNFSPAQRLALAEFVRWNAREENKYYAYDYFRDNCSTRLRDALDRVLGGAIRRATESVPTTMTYRQHAMRLMAEDPVVSSGMDIGLGRLADRRLSAWEDSFIPMKLRDHLRNVQVPDDAGRSVPLVTAERVVFEAKRPPEREGPPRRATLFLAISCTVAAGLALLVAGGEGRGALHRRTALGIIVAWAAVVGVIGMALVLLRTATRHEFAYDNSNLFFYNPLWLLLAFLVPLSTRWVGLIRVRDLTVTVALVVTVLGIVAKALPMFRQDNLAALCLAVPLNLAVIWAVRRLLTPAPTLPA